MEVVDILREGVGVALRIGAPLLILSMLVGILVAIFQAVTQIHEQSLSWWWLYFWWAVDGCWRRCWISAGICLR